AAELAEGSRETESWSALLQRVSLPQLNEVARALVNPMVDLAALKQAPDVKSLAPEAVAQVDEALFAQIFARLLPLVQSVRRELARQGAVSFDGLLVFARDLLRDHHPVREALKRRFAAFLVDEFQDTDPLQ